MCGIFVWISRDYTADPRKAADAVLSMRHRGPNHQSMLLFDADGTAKRVQPDVLVNDNLWQTDDGRVNVCIGHTRLSVIDLSPRSNQPMVSDEGHVLSFNGMIYNYLELKHDLETQGIKFRTSSDTEVLLHWLSRYGLSRNRDLNGSWAFAFFSPNDKSVSFSRDPYGERPLFYYADDKTFIAASEIKAIYIALSQHTRELDANGILSFIAFGNWSNVTAETTLHTKIKKLPGGSSLIFDLANFSFYITETNCLTDYFTPDLNSQTLAETIQNAVRVRLRSDVPIGVSLSGGVDSSIIAAELIRSGSCPDGISFYTAAFSEDTSSDPPWAKRVAAVLEIDLREIPIPTDDQLIPLFEQISHQYDQPVPFAGGTLSENTVFRAMAEDGVRVAITGSGGDEVFGGYGNEYVVGALNELLHQHDPLATICLAISSCRNGWISARTLTSLAVKRLAGKARTGSWWKLVRSFIRNDSWSKKTFTEVYWGADAFRLSLPEIQIADCQFGRMANYVTFGDFNAMQYSIELRSPMLDPNLIKYIRLPARQKYNRSFNKLSLRKAFSDAHPDLASVAWRREKQGYTFPFQKFYKINEKHILEVIFDSIPLAIFFNLGPFVEFLKARSNGYRTLLNLYAVAVFMSRNRYEIA